MNYTVFSSDEGWLKPVSTKVTEELLVRYGEIKKMIYNTYDADKAVVVGYVLTNGFYALKETK